eukprot:gnl/Dysnectes_brevis/2686_a3254_1401.p1 GENE.gnl/Dysnectes_brevis/2686_a3254_1401~~gnl/Dysnectes_brevis/2686_a3254_1401.p1  ORF type:complete len:118 (-),score=6.09 gnl/Dysnectes_brevis/2686_a3254_1401:549-902(-)
MSLMIIRRKTLPSSIEANPEVLDEFSISTTRKGWMTSDLFLKYVKTGGKYVKTILIPSILEKRAASSKHGTHSLFIVDGHSSRYNPVMLRLLREHKIIDAWWCRHDITSSHRVTGGS